MNKFNMHSKKNVQGNVLVGIAEKVNLWNSKRKLIGEDGRRKVKPKLILSEFIKM